MEDDLSSKIAAVWAKLDALKPLHNIIGRHDAKRKSLRYGSSPWLKREQLIENLLELLKLRKHQQ